MALPAAVILIAIAGKMNGATINAASPALTDVANAISLASGGDTVVIPAGTANWPSQLTISKAITLQGAGVGRTVILDSISGTGPLMRTTLVAGKTTRITGIEFRDGGTRTAMAGEGAGVFSFYGSNTDGSRLRVDHCYFNQIHGSTNTENCLGVFDHCTWDKAAGNAGGAIYCHNVGWNGGTWGDLSWTDQTYFGTDKFLFIEDCTFNGAGLDIGYGGSRAVVRYSTFIQNANGKAKLSTHGTDTPGRRRGVRALEVYNNTFSATNPGTNVLGELRSGIMLYHDNTVSGWGAAQYDLMDYRMFGQSSAIWGPVADGTQPWEVNDTTGGPSSNGIYYTGIANGNSVINGNATSTVAVTGSPGWTTNMWIGGVSDGGVYMIRRTTNVGNLNTLTASVIIASGSNTLTWGVVGGGSFFLPAVQFTNGDHLEIRKVVQALDQPGRCQGSQITGNASGPVPPAGWAPNDQVTEPCYSWNNTREGGAPVNFVGGDAAIREGTHFFKGTPMPGYTPYIYPHPLVSGVPTAPTDLRVIN